MESSIVYIIQIVDPIENKKHPTAFKYCLIPPS